MSRFEFYGPGLPAIEAGELKGKLIVVEGADGVGRSTHIALLKEWFENSGHAVLDTGTTCSALAGKGLAAATEGNTLGPIAMSLFYIYSLMARALVRGAEPRWVKGVYEFALKPDIVLYLRADVEQLVRRVVQTTGFNYWECGMDLNLGDDMYDSFLEYQGRLLRIFDAMSSEYRFHVVETIAPIQDVCDEMKNHLEPLFASGVPA